MAKRGRPVGSGARAGLPACEQHAGSRVTLNGHYGKGESRRQRFVCYPTDGSASHTFIGALARLTLSVGDTCTKCGTELGKHQGPTLVRRYDYPVDEVAVALVRVGHGMSYTEAAQRCRARTKVGAAVDAQLVANWVEVFTPVVAARYREDTWPETVVCDSTPLEAWRAGGTHGVVFHILFVYGYDHGNEDGHVRSIVASTRRDGPSWAKVLTSKQGQPKMLVSDKDLGLLAGAYTAWPTVVWRRCRWHLRQNLEKQLAAYGIANNPTHPISVLAADALRNLAHWQGFSDAVAAHGGVQLCQWVAEADLDLRAEFAALTLPPHYSNGAAEQALNTIRPFIAQRAFCYRNARRTNAMLELVRLRLNRQEDAARYAADIQSYLHAGGRLSPQRQILDPKGVPSLR